MIKAEYCRHDLIFKRPGGTSRGILKTKECYFIRLVEGGSKCWGIGECGLFRGLSVDDRPDYEQKLAALCSGINNEADVEILLTTLQDWPSIRFGFEMALLSYRGPDAFILFDNTFSKGIQGIEINGLIWMGDVDYMSAQIEEKLNSGFKCLKLKIGALDFDAEIELLRAIRKQYSRDRLEIRVDANGAFEAAGALKKLETLAQHDIHSIEQPIKQGQWKQMADLCKLSPIPIALDEELIGINNQAEKASLLQEIKPQYVILKPSLLGGFRACDEWVACCENAGVGYWLTSALESNIGLNAIAQYAGSLNPKMPQGLGTGALFSNNVTSPLNIIQDKLFLGKSHWDINMLDWNGQ